MVAYFCHHLSDNYIDLSDLYVDLSVIYVDLSDHYVDLLDNHVDLSSDKVGIMISLCRLVRYQIDKYMAVRGNNLL